MGTEVKKGNLNPSWSPMELTLSSLCNTDHHRPLKFTVEDWNKSGSHSMIGELETSVDALLQLSRGAELPLINQKKKSKKKERYRNSGLLIVRSCQLETRPTFLDFIQGGMELSFTVAVDFTASNGNPASPSSLHYNDPSGNANQYLTAIRAVGDIIQDYDTDKLFPALGFGARLPPDGRVSLQFFLNFSPSNPYCEGIDGVITAYQCPQQRATVRRNQFCPCSQPRGSVCQGLQGQPGQLPGAPHHHRRHHLRHGGHQVCHNLRLQPSHVDHHHRGWQRGLRGDGRA